MLLKNKIIKVYDNDGKTFDRYTISINDEYFFGMSEHPNMPNGFNMSSDITSINEVDEEYLGKEVYTLPEEVYFAILNRIGELYGES